MTIVTGELVLDPITGKPILDEATGRPYIVGPDGTPVIGPVIIPSDAERLENALAALMSYACDGQVSRFSRSLAVPLAGQRIEAFLAAIQAEREPTAT